VRSREGRLEGLVAPFARQGGGMGVESESERKRFRKVFSGVAKERKKFADRSQAQSFLAGL